MKTIFNLKMKLIKFATLLLLLPSLGSLAPDVFQGFGQRVNAQTIEILLNSEWNLIDSNVDGNSIAAEYFGGFYSPHLDDFFQHDYGSSCFETLKVSFTDMTQTSFNLDTIIEYISCNYTDPDEIAAVELYLSFYFELPFDTNSTPKNPFTYEWADAGYPVDDLIITNPEGDWLVYRRAFLSSPTFHQNNFTMYPNPVKENLTIHNTSNQSVKATIYDVSGKALQKNFVEANNSSLNVKYLTSGLYFIVFENEEGESVSKKFVKE